MARLGGAGARALVCHMWAWLEKSSVPSRPVLRGKYLLKLTCPMGTGPDKSSSTEVIN